MLFSGLTFLYAFLPVTAALYFLVPKGGRNFVLLAGSLFFYFWGEPKYLILLCAMVTFFYFSGLLIESTGHKRLALCISVCGGILALGVFKYADFFIDSFRAVTGIPMPLLRLALPMGISFYTFQCLSYVADVYWGKVRAQRKFTDFACYVCLFPQLVAGPIVRYADIAAELQNRTTTWEDFTEGLLRFCAGLGKKVILADGLAGLVAAAHGSAEPSVLSYWLYAIGFTLEIYYDFSGYSDMAIGLGRIFGFHFCENFNYPYMSRSITEFWRRWHMSLGAFFRDYVYIPLGGSRVSRAKWVRNILVVWMLTGLWHGAGWNFVLWGLLYAILLLAEKVFPKLKALPAGLSRVYVMSMVTLGFVVFNAEGTALRDFAGLFGVGIPMWGVHSAYLLRSYGVLLAVSAVGATPLPKALAGKLNFSGLQIAYMALILIVCTAALVSGSYSPFLYFRF